MEHGLAGPWADVHDHAVVVDPSLLRGLPYELEHPPRLRRVECIDLAEGLNVPKGDDQKVDRRLGRDVVDRNEAVCPMNDLGLLLAARDTAEDAAGIRQR
jgi:hypothetical protein